MVNMKNIYIIIPVLMLIFNLEISAQEVENKYSGYVYSARNGEPIPMATIKVHQSNKLKKQEFTGFEGEFEVTSEFSEILLEVSFPGYFSKKVFAAPGVNINVYLVENNKQSVHKKFMSNKEELSIYNEQFAIKGIKPDDHLKSSETLDDIVRGLPGVFVDKRSGMPGEGGNILIRGINTINTLHNPLIVIDGMVMGNFSFVNQAIDGNDYFTSIGINPNDIQDVVVLKDAAATAIYGIQGANGVIQITTNQVAMGQTTIDFKAEVGLTWDDQRLPLLDADQHRDLLHEQMFSQNLTLDDIENKYPFLGSAVNPGDYPVYDHNTNWQDEVYDAGMKTDFHLGLKGGDETAKFYGAVGYTHNEGVIKNSSFDRLSLRFNSNVNVTSKFSLDASFSFSYTNSVLFEQGTNYLGNPLFAAQYKTPRTGVLQALGNGVYNNIFEDADLLGFSNPAALVENAEGDRTTYFVTAGLDFTYQINPNLKAKLFAGTELNQLDEAYFRPDYGVGRLDGDGTYNYVSKKNDNYRALSMDSRIKYSKLFGYQHELSGTVGFRSRITELKTGYQWGSNTGSDLFTRLQDADSQTRRKIGSEINYNNYNFYLNAMYVYRNKLFFQASASLDGSTPIGANADSDVTINDVNMGLFYGAGIGYDIAKEPFMNSFTSWLDILKLKASYGKTGNDLFESYLAKDYYVGVQFYNVSGLKRGAIMNDEIKWEETSTVNVGLDISLLKETLNVGVEYYNSWTDDLLVAKDIKEITGFESVYTNEGKLVSDGLEFSLHYQVFDKDFKWNIGASVTSSNTELDELPNDEIIDVEGGWKINRVGEAPGSFYGFIYDGVISSNAEATELNLKDQFGRSFEAGDVKFKDIHKDGVIDEKDRTLLGNPFPELYGSLINSFQYKNWKLYTKVTFVEGRDVYNYARFRLESMQGYGNQSTAVLGRWQRNGDVTNMPKAQFGDPMGNSRFSDRWIEDGSYIRLQDVTLSYDFKVESSWLKSANVYLTGQNLLVLTDYLGNDPEFFSGNSIYGMGIDYFKSPVSPTVLLGVKIGF